MARGGRPGNFRRIAIAQATAERDRPVSFFSLFRRLTSKDCLRGLAEAVNFLQAFGRHLRSPQNSLPRD